MLIVVPAWAQDCEKIVEVDQQDGAFLWVASRYTMTDNQQRVITLSSMAVDNTVAIVFYIMGKEACIEQGAKVEIRFEGDTTLHMYNTIANCDRKSAMYFNDSLGNLHELEMFKTRMIDQVKIWTSPKQFRKVQVNNRIASEFKASIICLAEKMGTPPIPRVKDR